MSTLSQRESLTCLNRYSPRKECIMLLPKTQVTPNPQVLTTVLRHEVVLLSMVTSNYYTLNETGARIWRDLQAGLSLIEIIRQLEEHYEISSAQAQQSVLKLVHTLAAEQLVLVKMDTEEEVYG